jgi:hypothetical protein
MGGDLLTCCYHCVLKLVAPSAKQEEWLDRPEATLPFF